MLEKFRKIRFIYKTNQIHFDRRMMVFGVFLLISGFFWLLTSLGKEYSSTIDFPIIYENIPEDKVLSNELPKDIHLKVNAHGFSLLKHVFMFEYKAIKIDFEAYARQINTNKDNPSYRITTNNHIHEIAQQLESDIDLLHIKPDVIEFEFSRLSSKKVPIKANVDIDFAQQHQLKGKIKILPDSVTISGPLSVIDTVDFIKTKYLELEDINSKTQRNIGIEKQSNITVTPNRAIVIINVEKFTEQTISVPVELTNVPKGVNVNLHNESINVKFLIGLSKFDIVNKESFKAVIDYKKLTTDSLPNTLNVDLVKTPPYVTIINYSPSSINYYIQKK